MLGESRKKIRLQQLAASWKSCSDCALASGRTRVVFYRGDPDAKILVIGDAPGVDEDQRGLSFVGARGHALNDLLREARIDPDDVFFMDMVGCRPPNNRPPKPEELKACAPRTRAMINTVNPSVILMLGATAAKLAGLTSIGPWRGQPVEVPPKYRAVATYHPSFLIRQGNTPKLQRRTISDIKVARAISHAEGRSADES